jgi:tetratricopeptide (TPR) repeat protein
VSGSNNTVSITQNQGPTLEEFNRLLQAVAPPDAHSEIEAACKHLTGGDLSVAIYLLEDLKKRRGDKLSPREKYRVEANIGLAMERKGEFKKAAQHYIEAQRHQPQEDRARALEAIAYYHLDDKPKAHALAVEAVKDHPNCALAHAVRIRSAPPEVSVAELEASVLSSFAKKSRSCTPSAGSRSVLVTWLRPSDSPPRLAAATRTRSRSRTTTRRSSCRSRGGRGRPTNPSTGRNSRKPSGI